MRFVRCFALGFLTLLLAEGGWPCTRLAADTKPDKDSPFGNLIYPGAKSQRDYQKESIPARTANFTTGDDPDNVIKWYKEAIPRLPTGIVEGIARNGGGEPYRETVAAVYDSRSTDVKEKPARPVTVWAATARVSTDKVEDYTLTVVVTRGKDEALTHVTLTWLPGPRKAKK
jgi:hypothetical protein